MERDKSRYAPGLREFAEWLTRAKAIPGTLSKKIIEAREQA